MQDFVRLDAGADPGWNSACEECRANGKEESAGRASPIEMQRAAKVQCRRKVALHGWHEDCREQKAECSTESCEHGCLAHCHAKHLGAVGSEGGGDGHLLPAAGCS